MRVLKTLHLASFDGNIGDNANHYGFYKYLNKIDNFSFKIDKLEIREFYWKKRFFNKEFVNLVNSYDLLIVGGGNYFELWVEDSPTGTSIAIDLQDLKDIKTPILFNALGVDDGQGVSDKNLTKFKNFLELLIKRGDYISIRNDGAKDTLSRYFDDKYIRYINQTPDAGFFVDVDDVSNYYKDKKYIAINVATDMPDVRFKDIEYKKFLQTFKRFIINFLDSYVDYEVVFIPHIFRDISFTNDILDILDDEIRRKKITIAPLLHGDKSFKEIMAIYKNASFVLANRFHANVCSIGLNTPTIGLVNYKQIKELYKELGSDSFVDITKDDFDKEILLKLKSNNLVYDTTILYKNMEKNFKKISNWLGKYNV